MKYFKLKRRTKLPNCSIGQLSIREELVVDLPRHQFEKTITTPIGYTVEKPWKENEPFVSCVPLGWYDLIEHPSPAHGNVPALSNPELGVTVYGPSKRTLCLFHIANFPENVVGCIGPGLDVHSTRWGVVNSADAMEMVLKSFQEGVVRLLIE